MKRFISALGVALLLVSANASQASLVTWNGFGTFPIWSDTGNWDTDPVAPATNDDIDLRDTSNASSCTYDNLAANSPFGDLLIGNTTTPMAFYVEKSNISFSSTSIAGDWSLASTASRNMTAGPMFLDPSIASSLSVTLTNDRTISASSLAIDADVANQSRSLTLNGSGSLVVSGNTTLTADDDTGNYPASLILSAGTLTPNALHLLGGNTSSRKAGFYYNGGTLTSPASVEMKSYAECRADSANVHVPVVGNLTISTSSSCDTHAEVKMASGKELQPAGFVIQGAASTYSAECSVTGGAIVTQGP